MYLAPKGEVAMSISRIAGLFLAVAVSGLTPGSATAGADEGAAAYDRGDYHAAFREFMALAVAGESSAQVIIGLMYANGEGVFRDYAEAVRWFRMAADQGNTDAQDSLGGMYRLGQGVPQNYAEAVRWYRMAAKQGHARAQASLGAMYSLGVGVPQNEAEAVRWYRMAADQGHGLAQYMVAYIYFNGEGVPQDYAQAYIWAPLATAGLQGEDRKTAAMLRDDVATRLTPAERARAQEMARNWRPTVAARTEREARAYGDAGRSELRSSHAERSPSGSLRVMEVQQSLAGMGYDPGPVDGVIGSRTRAAIRAFQADTGLPVDGQ